MGTPRAIPGRVNLIDFDDGGAGVGFQTVHSNGDVGCAGYDYRPKPVPTLCKTSMVEGDHWSMGPMMGTQYPSATTADYYVGAIRPGDWVQVTVDVKTAGMYQLSTSWASAGGSIDVKISMNGTMVTEYKGPATGDYHNWVPGPNFAQVMLTAGVQVMRFQSVVEHVNMDYVQFTLVGPGGTLDPSGSGGAGGTGAGGTTGTAGTGGASGAGTAGAAGGAGGTTGTAGAGTAGAAGTTGAAGDTSGGTGTAGATGPGTAGDSGATGAAGTGSTGTAGTGTSVTGTGTGTAGTGVHVNRSSGGCALASGDDAHGAWLLLAGAAAIAFVARRRARR
jgi:MYXO-CTERM domain-containing protein